MNALMRALSAEILKLRRTLAVAMVWVTPAVVCFINLMIASDQENTFGSTEDTWMALASNHLSFWTILALPLFITLETALMANAEHSEKTWKHLFAMPLPRWTVYAAKWLVGAGLTAASSLALVVFTILNGLLIRSMRPDLNLSLDVPVLPMLLVGAKAFVISLFILSIHTYIANRYRSIAVAFGAGMVASVMNLAAVSSDKGLQYFPWSMPASVLPVMDGMFSVTTITLWALVGAAVAGLLGMVLFTRRDVL